MKQGIKIIQNLYGELERIGGTLFDEGVEAVSKRNIILLPKSV